MSKRCFTDAGRTDQAKYRRFQFIDTTLHRKIFDDPFFDFFKPVVIGVEYFFRVRQIGTDLGFFLPGQRNDGIDVVTHDGCLSRHWRHQFQFLQFRLGLGARLFGHVRGLDFLFELIDLGTLFGFAELFLYCLDLLVQVVLALRLFHLALDTSANSFFNLQDIDFSFQQAEQLFETRRDVEILEDLLLLFELER